jgi:tryptophanyl-tRNA synthetase
LGYGDLKKALFEHYWDYFAAARSRRSELTADPGYVHGVLTGSAEKARALARKVLARVRLASGLD